MYLFMRRATVANGADMPAATGWALEVCGYMKKNYGLDLKAGGELFGKMNLYWWAEFDSLEKISAIYQKLLQDKTYLAMLDKANPYWVVDSMRDQVIVTP